MLGDRKYLKSYDKTPLKARKINRKGLVLLLLLCSEGKENSKKKKCGGYLRQNDENS